MQIAAFLLRLIHGQSSITFSTIVTDLMTSGGLFTITFSILHTQNRVGNKSFTGILPTTILGHKIILHKRAYKVEITTMMTTTTIIQTKPRVTVLCMLKHQWKPQQRKRLTP